jgi:hypothetical protein
MSRIRKPWRTSRKAIVAAFVALSLTVVLVMVAVALDGGAMLDRQRNAQTVADAAAMAAACDLYARFPTNGGLDLNGTAAAAARAVAATNGYQNDATNLNAGNGQGNNGNGNGNQATYADATSRITVYIPPSQGPYRGVAGYAEVLVSYYQPIYFGRLAGKQQKEIQARAVARGSWTPHGAGVIVLDYTGAAALNDHGNGAFTETNGPVIVNSNDNSAVADSGNGSLRAESFFITGGATLNGNAQMISSPVPNQIYVGVHPTPDPLAYLPAPAAPAAGTMTTVGNTTTLTPGRFTSMPIFHNNDVVVFQQASANGNGGIYYLDGCGLKSTGGTLIMDTGTTGGMMIYNTGPNGVSGAFDITGNPSGSVTLAPLTSGPYAGMMFWQDRASPTTISITGNGNFNVTGTVYGAGALMKVTGNGGSSLDANGQVQNGSQIGSQFIIKDLTMGGNGNVFMGYPGRRANARFLTLVE